jgi:hypothetical protein
MKSFNGKFGVVNNLVAVRGRGIEHRNLNHDQRIALALGLQNGTVSLDNLSRKQALAVAGVTKSEMRRARRKANGNGLAPPAAALAADLVEMVGLDTAFDLLVEANPKTGS